ncbi:hypothetical protein FE257_003543 [Aspergillus nanangensis]|uniref:Major facilitator superfamily (MFS) profile domain-containing protein n=1 Tax=Aspergillus nanangensis TaxID=2582783 RepID=A0AAD4GNI3_ASPNN|nr:hypothetical protein FE257_003543 [Aspergillus nanangensis]
MTSSSEERESSLTRGDPLQKQPQRHEEEDGEFAPEEQRKIIHRIDHRLIVMLGFLHTVSLIDRGNIGTAAVAGMKQELRLVGTQYSIIAVAFFPPYICLQPLGPVLIRKIGPINYLTGVCFIWGVVMRGLGGLGAWRWIFVIQGLITCVIAAISYFVLVDFPDKMLTSKRPFLQPNEYEFILRRIERDRGDTALEPFNWKHYLRAGLDWNIWAFGLIYFCTTTTAYAISHFLPIIYNEGMGFSMGVSLCLFAPPYAAAGTVMFATLWVGDRYRIRGVVIVFNAMLTLIGLPLMGFATSNAARLVGAFFITMGANSNVLATMAYQANNVRGQWKRAICSAIFVGLGASGGMTGSLVYREQDAPTYRPGICTCMGLTGLSIVLVALLSIRLRAKNRQADRGELVIGNLEGFRYTL